MKESSNKYALAAVRDHRALLAAEIQRAEAALRHLRRTLKYVDGTLRLMKPDADPSSIKPKRTYNCIRIFGKGKLNRIVLTVLRKADRPMRTLDIIDAVAIEAGMRPEAAKGVSGRVRANLYYLHKMRGLILKDGERETATWRLP